MSNDYWKFVEPILDSVSIYDGGDVFLKGFKEASEKQQVLLVSIIGLIKCFEANGGADGKNFLVRATCLSFPIGIKINILYLLLVWGTYYIFPKIIDGTTFQDPIRVYMLLMFLISATTTILLYRRLWVHKHDSVLSLYHPPTASDQQSEKDNKVTPTADRIELSCIKSVPVILTSHYVSDDLPHYIHIYN